MCCGAVLCAVVLRDVECVVVLCDVGCVVVLRDVGVLWCCVMWGVL